MAQQDIEYPFEEIDSIETFNATGIISPPFDSFQLTYILTLHVLSTIDIIWFARMILFFDMSLT